MKYFLCIFIALALTSNLKANDTLDQKIKSLQMQRLQEKSLRDEASRDADRYFSQDWLTYRRALLRQEYLEHRIQQIDEQIAELQKQKK